MLTKLLVLRHVLDDVTVTRVGDGHARHGKVFTASSTKVDVGTSVVVDTSLGKHGVVLDLGLGERRTVIGNDNQPS